MLRGSVTLEASASISTIRSRGSSSRQSAEPEGEPAELQRSRGREPHEPRERDGGLHVMFLAGQYVYIYIYIYVYVYIYIYILRICVQSVVVRCLISACIGRSGALKGRRKREVPEAQWSIQLNCTAFQKALPSSTESFRKNQAHILGDG